MVSVRTIMAQSARPGVATAGWGIGLVLMGAIIVAAAAAFLADYKGVARRYHESVVAAHEGVRTIGGRYRNSSARNFRISVGAGFLFLGIAIVAVGIFGLSRS
jgi:hypothetical protein